MNALRTLVLCVLCLPNPGAAGAQGAVEATLIVRDSDGTVVVPPEAEVAYRIVVPELELSLDVEAKVKYGRFEVRWPQEFDGSGYAYFPELDIGRIRIGGREAFCSYYSRNVGYTEPLRIEAQWLPSATLTVVGSGGVESLGALEVWCGSSSDRGDRVLQDATSPISLVPVRYVSNNAWTPFRTWWVRAPGYKWSSVLIDHRIGGDHTVYLTGEARLAVDCREAARSSGFTLRLAMIGEIDATKYIKEVLPNAEYVQFDDLAPGHYVLRALSVRNEEVSSAAQIVEVRGGDVACVECPLLPSSGEPLLRTDSAPVAIDLRIPELWMDRNTLGCWFVPQIVGARTPVRAQLSRGLKPSNERQWSLVSSLQGGLWRLRLDGIGWSHQFEHKGGATNVKADVPEPIRVHVICIDKSSGAALTGTALFWCWAEDFDPHYYGALGAIMSESESSTQIVVPAGESLLLVRRFGYIPSAITIDSRVQRSARIELAPSARFGLRLVSGGAEVYAPHALPLEISSLGGQGSVSYRSSDQKVHRVEVTHPGAYRVAIAPFSVYKSAVIDVTAVANDADHVITVQLERSE